MPCAAFPNGHLGANIDMLYPLVHETHNTRITLVLHNLALPQGHREPFL